MRCIHQMTQCANQHRRNSAPIESRCTSSKLEGFGWVQLACKMKNSRAPFSGWILMRLRALATSSAKPAVGFCAGQSGDIVKTSDIRGRQIRFGKTVLSVTSEMEESTTSRGLQPSARIRLIFPTATYWYWNWSWATPPWLSQSNPLQPHRRSAT